jgi:BirA family biotin operon repressor/biotin-[acetyl-CoA-carboxylase] ligase
MTLPALPAGWVLDARLSVGSTNEEAKALARAGAREGAVVWALEQTAGRGRRGRSWASPSGNLYLSLVLRPEGRPSEAAGAGLAAAVAAAKTVSSLLPEGAAVALKWPNDVLVGGRKLAGILPEAAVLPDGRVEWVVLGIGVNLVSHPAETPYPATNLAAEGSGPVAIETALERLAQAFDHWLRRWREEGFGPIRSAWLALALGLGQPIEVRLESGTMAGRFVDLDGEGALLLEIENGHRRRVAAGEVFFPGLGE